MKLTKIALLQMILLLLLTACSESEERATSGAVAADFWAAMELGDRARAEQLVVPGSLDGSTMNFEAEGNRIESIRFGEAMVSSDMAAVPTTMVGVFNERPVEFSFDTRLVPIEGVWKVDFNTTSTGMMGAMLKQAMSTFSEVMAEGVGQAMTEIGSALSESADVLADSLREGFQQGASGLSQGLDSASDALRRSQESSAPVTLVARVSGEIKGSPVALVASEWGNTLAIYQGDGWGFNPSILLFLFLPEAELPIDRTITVADGDPSFGHPHVHYRWWDSAGELQTTVLTGGYNLQLQFGAAIEGRVDGTLRFDVPGEETRLQGEFSIRVD
ncbi:hypothetical protein A9Q89_08755 [Gammaproteobacteria bacterium 53_120_T64]|nr:hypothetical protein A9Q89_08755 [Gammaproteobacteria bacterium 53_120_T64]